MRLAMPTSQNTAPLSNPRGAELTFPWSESEPERAAPRTPIRLLVVEDDPIQQKAYQAVSRQFGFFVTVVSRTTDVLRVALTEKPHAMILDLKVEDGVTLGVLTSLRRSPETRTLPVAVISAYLLPEVREELMSFEGVECLAKPWSLEELLSLIGRMTGRPPAPPSGHSQGA